MSWRSGAEWGNCARKWRNGKKAGAAQGMGAWRAPQWFATRTAEPAVARRCVARRLRNWSKPPGGRRAPPNALPCQRRRAIALHLLLASVGVRFSRTLRTKSAPPKAVSARDPQPPTFPSDPRWRALGWSYWSIAFERGHEKRAKAAAAAPTWPHQHSNDLSLRRPSSSS